MGYGNRWLLLVVRVLVTVAAFGAHGRLARAEIQISFSDRSVPPGKFSASVDVSGDQPVSSLNISLGTSLLSGHEGSSLLIESFDPTAPVDSIWGTLPILFAATPPGLPSTNAKLNNTIALPSSNVLPQGSVLGLVLDATNARPGDVFQIDLNYFNRTTAADNATLVTDQLTFRNGTVTILAPSGDFNGDGVLDASDIDALTSAVKDESDDLAFDLDGSGTVDQGDRDVWVTDLRKTYYGDANLDGEFSSPDFIQVLQAGEYEDAVEGNSTWATGDWDGDCEFDTADLIQAFQSGGYELGPREAVSAVKSVPEPSSGLIWSISGPLLWGWIRRRHVAS